MSRVTRRDVLRGVGASIALPWLEALAPRHAHAEETVPSRFALWSVPNGLPMDAWHPAGSGPSWVASPLLAPLERHRDQLSILGGLRKLFGKGYEPHLQANLTALTGFEQAPWDLPPTAGFQSLDQLLAGHLGVGTAVASLQLSSEGPAFCSEAASGLVPSCAGYSTYSWADGATPLPRQFAPHLVFDQLFGAGDPSLSAEARASQRRKEQSILDAVLSGISRLTSRVSAADRQTLDQYLTGVRELERQLDQLEVPLEPTFATQADQLLRSGSLDLVQDVAGHVAAMRELMVLALQCDRTRVITYMLGNERSDRPFPHLGILDSHHQISHHMGDPGKLAALQTIGAWEVEMWAQLLDRLAQIPEGDGTLLDHTLAVFFSPLADPDTHEGYPLPVVLAGGARDGWIAGGHVELAAPGRFVPLADLWLTIAQRYGVEITSFGLQGTSTLSW